eukprot:6470260-Amphidinium_carterae.1
MGKSSRARESLYSCLHLGDSAVGDAAHIHSTRLCAERMAYTCLPLLLAASVAAVPLQGKPMGDTESALQVSGRVIVIAEHVTS